MNEIVSFVGCPHSIPLLPSSSQVSEIENPCVYVFMAAIPKLMEMEKMVKETCIVMSFHSTVNCHCRKKISTVCCKLTQPAQLGLHSVNFSLKLSLHVHALLSFANQCAFIYM